MKELLIIVDLQNDFVTGALGTKDAQRAASRIAKKLAKSEKDLIFTLDTHDDKYLETQEGRNLPIVHCVKGTEGWKLVPEVTPFLNTEKCKAFVEKTAFGGVTLISLVKDYDSIELVGVCTDICVIANALLLKSFYPEKLISVDKKCCAGSSKKAHNATLEVMKSCQIIVN